MGSHVAEILKQEISRCEAGLDVVTVGRVLDVGDGIARISRLKDAMAGEMLLFEDAEHFMYDKHRDTLCVYDDLSKLTDRINEYKAGYKETWKTAESH